MKAKAKVFCVVALNPANGKLVVISASHNPSACSIAAGMTVPEGWATAPVVGEIEVPVTTVEGADLLLQSADADPTRFRAFIADTDEVVRLQEADEIGAMAAMLSNSIH